MTERLPNQPAAVLLYDNLGCAPVVVFDFDTSRGNVADGGADAVARDLGRLVAALRRAGATSWFMDRSPSGGQHLYLPLAEPAPIGEVTALMRGLRLVLPTLDQAPMVNPTAGCIRPPGARHRTGGYQELDGTIEAALRALNAPNSARSWAALLAEASSYLPVDAPTSHSASGDVANAPDGADTRSAEAAPLEPLRGYRDPSEAYMRIFRTGVYDTEAYKSPSEARLAALWAAVACGWSLSDVVRRLEDGTFRGLASLYAKYAPTHRRTTLAREWHKAHSFEKSRRQAAGKKCVRESTTSTHKTHRGEPGASATAPHGLSVQQQVRTWLNAVDLLAQPTDNLAYRAVLHALAEAAILKNSLILEFGNRALAVASGPEQSTVGRILNELSSAPADRLLIDLIRPASGVRANTYTLIVPALLRAAAEAKPWRRGRIHAIRPAFRELGLAAAFVYAVLEQAEQPLSGRDIAAQARIGVTATYEALATLAAWGLADRTGAGWALGSASLSHVAEQVDAVQAVQEQLARYRAERLAWWRYLGVIDIVHSASVDEPRHPPPLPRDLGHTESSLQLVERLLGAVPIKEPTSIAG